MLFLTVCEATTSWKCYYKDTIFTCRGWKINKLETVLFVSVFCFLLLFDWIPFTTDSYGSSGPWCFIHRLESNCSIHEAGFLQVILLWEAPFVSLGLLALGLFIISLCLLAYVIKNSKAKNLNKMGISDSIFSLALMLALYLLIASSVIHLSIGVGRLYSLDWWTGLDWTGLDSPKNAFFSVGQKLSILIHSLKLLA